MIDKIINIKIIILGLFAMIFNANLIQVIILIYISLVLNLKISKIDNENFSISGSFFKIFIFNMIIGLSVLFINKITHINPLYITSFIFIAISIFSLVKSFRNEDDEDFKLDMNYIYISAISLILVIVAQYFYYSNFNLDFHNTLNMDSLAHITAIKSIFESTRLDAFLTDVNPMFTLNTYLPIFHWLLYPYINSSSLENSMFVYNVIQGLFIVCSSTCLGMLVHKYTKNIFITTIAIILHIFTIEMTSAFTSLFMLPQTLATLWGVIIIYEYINEKKIDRDGYILIFLSLFFLFMLHIYIASFVVLFLVIIFVLKKQENIILSLILTFGTLLLIYNLIFPIKLDFLLTLLSDSSFREGESISFTLLNVLQELWKSNLFMSGIVFAGLISSIFGKDREIKIFAILFTTTLMLISLNIPYSTKLLTFFHYLSIPLIILVFQYSIFKFKYISLLIIPLILFVYIGVFNINIERYKYITNNYNSYGFRTITDREIQTKINRYITNTNTYVISDPLTMHMYEPFIEGTTTGGIFTQPYLRDEIYTYLNHKDNRIISELFPNDIIIVLTPKTLQWMEYDSINISQYLTLPWASQEELDKNCDRYKEFELVEMSNKFCIYKLK